MYHLNDENWWIVGKNSFYMFLSALECAIADQPIEMSSTLALSYIDILVLKAEQRQRRKWKYEVGGGREGWGHALVYANLFIIWSDALDKKKSTEALNVQKKEKALQF